MIEKVIVKERKRDVECLEFRLFAFKTPKGTFTLSGTNANGTDEWRQLGTCNFYTWERSSVYEWLKLGKISAISEAKNIDWYQHTINKKIIA